MHNNINQENESSTTSLNKLSSIVANISNIKGCNIKEDLKSPNDKNNNNFKYLNSNKLDPYYTAPTESSFINNNNSTTNSSTSMPSPLSDHIL